MNALSLPSLWRGLDAWFHEQVPATRLGAFRALVCAVALFDVLLYSQLVFQDAATVTAGGETRPWTPIYLFQVLRISPIGTDTAQIVLQVAVCSLTCGMLGIASRLSCLVGAAAFYYWTGLAYSFGKPHHDKIALAFAIAALPFARVGAAASIDAVVSRLWRKPNHERLVSGMPIRIAQFTIALGYCGAGIGKVLIGGVEWFNGYTLQGIMLGHDGPWSHFFASSVALAQLQSFGLVLVQAAFPLVLIWPRSRWFFLPFATIFHLMTWKTMDTGPYMRLWLLLWAFVAIEEVPGTLRRWIAGGGVRAWLTMLGGIAYMALIFWVARGIVSGLWMAAISVVLATLVIRSPRDRSVDA
ncbi:MAG: hypothetical protein ACI89X_002911 [Planctomycetota bacterium]|jgi:hypothetical protein